MAGGPIGQVREQLVITVGGTSSGGGTALYDAVADATEKMKEFRKKYGDAYRYGIVVLSDGRDESSQKFSLSQIESLLKPNEADPHGIQMHTICIGSDCDEGVLKKIARAANGQFWKGNTEAEIVKIYKGIAAYY